LRVLEVFLQLLAALSNPYKVSVEPSNLGVPFTQHTTQLSLTL
jgi:hypothetical protein